ncbi:MAG: two-component regulator propeller domain-containing protein [Terracidiphilus sp.]|jgi:ligand-binding sensor domain-containing protein/signal transduction histidine kinase
MIREALLFVEPSLRGGYFLNVVSNSFCSPLWARSNPSPARLLAGLLLTVVGMLAPIAPSAQAQQSAVETITAGSEEWNYTTRSWQSQDGLPEETVQSFAQTSDGYLWVGTSGGLLRFDGARFRLFAHENTPAFGENSVFCLLAARDGRLWIGTDGSGLIEAQHGVFHAYPAATGQTANFVRALAEDHNGLLWVATDDGLFWAKNDHLERADKPLGLPIFNVHAVMEDHTGRIWVGGSRMYALKNGVAHEYSLPENDSRNKVKSFLETPDGVVWVGTVGGLYRLQPGANRFEPLPGVFGTIRSLSQAPNGELWAGSIGEGIFRIREDRVTRLKAPSPLVSNTVLSILVDSERNLWIGTQAGMMRLSRTPVRVVDLPASADSDFGTVALDTDGSLWAASNQLVHVQGGHAAPFKFPGLADVRVRNVLRSRDGSLWIGTDGSGIFHIPAKGTQHFTTREGLVNNFVRVFLESRDGSLWIGTDNGVSHLDRSGFHNFTGQNGLAYNSIRSLLEDRDGTIWIGTEHGLSQYRGGEFVHNAMTAALGEEKVWALHQDVDGGIWIGTRAHGLYRYRNGQLSHYTTANGLASDSIYSILEDKLGHFWFSGPSGVMLLNRAELDAQVSDKEQLLSLRIFRANEGGKPAQFYGGTQPAGAITRSGEAWFPTSQGLWSIRPDELEHPFFSSLNIDAVTVDGRPAQLSGNLNLDAGAGREEIAYEPVLLGSQEGLRFRYRLVGYDRNWTYANAQQRLATYTNLPAGQYKFVVEAWETDQPGHAARASIGFTKRPYFYRTPWFIALCALTIALLSILAYQARMKHIHDRFKAVLAERTRLAREMHDTLIQGCVSISALLEAASSREVDDNESRLHLIDYAATQIRSTVDEARQAVWNLRGEEGAIVDLETALRRMSERIGREHDVEMIYRLTGRPFALSLPAAHELMMVSREAVFNAILHGHAKRVEVNLSFADGSLSLAIKDDGEGFDATEAFSEGHFGLRGMQERIHRFEGKFEIDSRPHQGTCVRLEIPRVAIAT